MPNYAVQMLNITKRFPSLVANDDITFEVEKGSVHALLGENGAGKSTLMSILFGLIPASSGRIFINGQEVVINSPNDANALKIGMVHQHFKLINSYTVCENIILGHEVVDKLGQLDYKTARKRIVALSQKYGLNINVDDKIKDISVGMQQRVEILKVLYGQAEIIVLDEPTAVLTPQEIDELLLIIQNFKKEGKTIIFISHKLKEIAAVAQKVTIIRRGKYIDTLDVAGLSEEVLAEKMVGRPVKLQIEKGAAPRGDEILAIENLFVRNIRGNMAVNNLSLRINAGEITGIAGVDGNGQSELIQAIFGLLPIEGGRILYKNKNITHLNPLQHIRLGMALSPEDRHLEGLVLDLTLDENLVLKNYYLREFSTKHGFLKFDNMKTHAERLLNDFDVRSARGYQSLAGELSGGNQQKLLLAREIDSRPELLVVCQPTRGLDVGSIEYIHRRIVAERDRGVAVLLVSFELEEIMGLCDKIAAISHGHIAAMLDAETTDSYEIGALMAGAKKE